MRYFMEAFENMPYFSANSHQELAKFTEFLQATCPLLLQGDDKLLSDLPFSSLIMHTLQIY